MQLDRRLFNGKIISSVVYPECFPIHPTDDVVNLGCGVAPQAVVYKGSFNCMVGVDTNAERLASSHILLAEHGVTNYSTVAAPVESTGLESGRFDKALAIDIIEHLPHPKLLLDEAKRLLKPGGVMLITVPAMHDLYVHGARRIARMLGKRTSEMPHGHPDAHNSDFSLREWEQILAASGFEIVRTRASTLFPPLHLYGVPRFWFTVQWIHTIDSFFCRLPIIKRFGQAMLFVLRKPTIDNA